MLGKPGILLRRAPAGRTMAISLGCGGAAGHRRSGRCARSAVRDASHRRQGKTYERVRDAGGAVHGAKSTEDGANDGSDHWSSGRVEPIEAGPVVLTLLQMRVIAGAKARNSRYW